MLAQNFQTAKQLKIGETMYDALIKVLGMLEREEIPEHLFDMKIYGKPECGTPGCILGWAKSIDTEIYNTPLTSSLYGLFHPGRDWSKSFDADELSGYSANRSQAAMVLRNYLRTGKANWHEIMNPQGV